MERPDWRERTGGAPIGDDGLGMTELAGGVDEGAVDLGDDVHRGPTNTEGVLGVPAESETDIDGGPDAGVVDLGEDVDRLATE